MITAPIYALSVGSFVPMLKNLSGLLDKAAAQIGIDAPNLVDARLAPDMFTLAQQVQQACHYAANGTARLAGQHARAMPVAGATIGELKTQIADTISFVSAISEADFVGAEDHDCSIDIPNNLMIEMDGLRFLRAWSLPHFFFHVVTAYDILRHEGVAIGKKDFISVGDLIRPRAA